MPRCPYRPGVTKRETLTEPSGRSLEGAGSATLAVSALVGRRRYISTGGTLRARKHASDAKAAPRTRRRAIIALRVPPSFSEAGGATAHSSALSRAGRRTAQDPRTRQ